MVNYFKLPIMTVNHSFKAILTYKGKKKDQIISKACFDYTNCVTFRSCLIQLMLQTTKAVVLSSSMTIMNSPVWYPVHSSALSSSPSSAALLFSCLLCWMLQSSTHSSQVSQIELFYLFIFLHVLLSFLINDKYKDKYKKN